MHKATLWIAVFLITSLGAAQQALNNDAIVKMIKAGLSDELIVTTVNSSPGNYDTSADGLIALKGAGASDKIVAAIVSRASSPPTPASTPASVVPPPPADQNDPASPHDPGIYLLTTSHDGKKTMTLIDRAGSGHEKTANVWGHAFSYGIAKAKIKAELPGPRAVVRADNSRPEFYMYFPAVGNLGAADTISSPSQFSLLRLEEKKDHRETAVFKVGFASASSGTDEKNTFAFRSDKVRPYVYKIDPQADLRAGEYAFIAATGMGGTASASAVVVYDFGVDLR